MVSHSGVGTWRVAVVRVLSSSTPWHLMAGTEVSTDTLPPRHSGVELKMQGGRAGTAGWRGGVADLGEGQAVSSFAAKRPSDFHECP